MESEREAQSTASTEDEGTGADREPSPSSAEEQDTAPEPDSDGQDTGDDDEDSDGSSGASVAHAIDDVSGLPGQTVNDQDGRKVGEVKEIYAVGDEERPMWVTIESATGLGRSRQVFVPLARIKRQADELRVPYSYDHVHEAPEVEPGDELSEQDDRALRVYYAIGLGDQELVQGAQSYASQVPEGDDPAHKVDADSVERPAREIDDTPSAERAAQAYEEQKEKEGDEHRKGREATAADVVEEDGGGEDKEGGEDAKEGGGDVKETEAGEEG